VATIACSDWAISGSLVAQSVASIAARQADSTSGSRFSQNGDRTSPTRTPAPSPAASSRPNSTDPSRRASAASRHIGPPTPIDECACV
jgi:hypothetical protein